MNILLLKPGYFSCRKKPTCRYWSKQVCDIFWDCNESLLHHSVFSFLSFLFLSFKLTSFSCAWGRRQLIEAEFLFTDKFRRQPSSEVPWISYIPTTFFFPLCQRRLSPTQEPDSHCSIATDIPRVAGRVKSFFRSLLQIFFFFFFPLLLPTFQLKNIARAFLN